MIGHPQTHNLRWLQATAISLSLHALAIGLLIYQPNFANYVAPPRTDGPEIQIETLVPQFTPAEGNQIDQPPLDPPDGLARPNSESTVVGAPPVTATPEVLQPLTSDNSGTILSTPPLAPVVILPEPIEAGSVTGPTDPDEAPLSPPSLATNPDTEVTPTDPRLTDLVTRLREQVDIACLMALPSLQDDALTMNVLSPNDREITSFIAAVSNGFDQSITSRRVILDQRQCPGITFLRRNPQYPAFGLNITLQSADISSGSSIVGQIGNGAGWYNTLLLIDDNGVVQDLRRFLTAQGGQVTFDIPMSRAGAARDTSQILIAIATPGRLQSVTRNAGRLARDFFPELAAELDQNARIGVSSLYIR